MATRVARELVLFLRRPGGQDQVSVSLDGQGVHTRPLRELQVWMLEHLDRPLSVDALADCVAMSARSFARTFAREFGTTPGRDVRQVRLEAARRLLEPTDQSVAYVAAAAGFGSVDVMRRVFVRTLRTTPVRYRRHFDTPAPSVPPRPGRATVGWRQPGRRSRGRRDKRYGTLTAAGTRAGRHRRGED